MWVYGFGLLLRVAGWLLLRESASPGQATELLDAVRHAGALCLGMPSSTLIPFLLGV